MTRLRTRVRLTAADWQAISEALAWAPYLPKWRRVDAKIGAGGMAARDRGVAPVRKAKR